MLFVLLGSSGSGKTTLGEVIFGKQKELISFTTRPKRENEIDGIDYHFITEETFNELLKDKKLAEHTIYSGNHYGLMLSEIESKTSMGDCYAVMDYNGYCQLKNKVVDTTSIFVSVNKETLLDRLEQRGETQEFIAKRIKLFEQEELLKDSVDLVIQNNETLEISTDQFKAYLKPYILQFLEPFNS